jgi:phage shock protein PspC (stress-responsive transcriptional regulator)
MKAFLKKLTSRKFITCVAGIVLGICTIFGLDESTVNTISGAVMSAASVVAYICAEGKIDATNAKNAVDQVADAIDAVKEIK